MDTRPTRLLLPALLLILAMLGCNLANITGGDKTVIVTATPSSPDLLATPDQAAPPTVPYVTPTPPPVPTSTLPPDVALADAQLALKNGDFVTAVDLFESVIGQPNGDPQIQSMAAYGLGEAALREGLYDQAAAALTEFIRDYPDDSRLPQAHFLRGDAYLGLSEWQRAIEDFKRYLELRPGIIDSYAHERIGDAYLALNQPEQSLQSYAAAAAATRALTPLLALRERLAASYLNAGQPQAAVEQYDAILAEAQNGPYRASIMYQAAQVLLNNGDVANGNMRLQAIIRDHPTTYPAYQAMGILLEAGLRIDAYQRGLIAYSNEDYQAAIQALNDHTSETGTASVEVLMMLGRAYRAVGNSQAANTTFQTVIDTYPTDPAYGEAWLEQGRTLFLMGDTAGAIQKYTALATEHPDVPQGAEALWRAGYLYSTQNDLDNALATFDILGQTFPGTEWAQEGLFMGATLAYNAGNTGQAAQLFSQLASTGTGEHKAAAYLWVARLYQSDGKEDLARQAYQAAAAADPGGYYSLRADDLLHGRAPFEPPPNVAFEFDDAAQLAEAENWLRATFNITQEGMLYPLSAELEADPRLIRGRELLAVTDYEDAEEEFEALRRDRVDDPLATYQLAIYLRDLGLYRLSITAAATLLTDAGVTSAEAPDYIERLRYPIYYADLVLPAADEYDVDPLLIFALIRQESLFEGFATSYAAAQGLMQIIPDTGEWIANQLGWPENYQNRDVYRPYINVEYGIFYLSWVMDQVQQLPYAALAGYNGGPGNAIQWLGISGPDLDLFVQTIGFDETRTYVRRIYEQYSVYRDLYGVPAASAS
ncbi:MAG: tetratricopeptide repeat protein [Chloroflexi bacterium]|nr:tetratricopeptide repeat protein [Chloroflexota bacterium]